MERKKILILGAAGRDFHNFNLLFRSNPDYEVVCFTANQIPFIANRRYPKELSGKLYPEGIMIHDESQLQWLIKRLKVDICVQSYSDLPYNTVMEKASVANACGADFWLVAPENTMLKSRKPVIAVCAVRTGSGKSQTSRYVANLIKKMGLNPVAIRHPMPYGILKDQMVQRFAKLSDLDKYKCTIEEREDYEPHIRNNTIIYSGVDYGAILKRAEAEADVIIWDGGNNDTSFIKPDLLITVADPLRVGNELSYYPGETAARMADVLLINKVNSATKAELDALRKNLTAINPRARIVLANSVVKVDKPELIRGKRVLAIEDGPTVTHGSMKFGSATVACRQYHAKEIVDAEKSAVGTIRGIYRKYPHLSKILPAIGYSKDQIKELSQTINKAHCDAVVSGTPTDLRLVLKINKPLVTVSYELQEIGRGLETSIYKTLRQQKLLKHKR